MPASAKRILIAPLDWGLGHATRCIPIIRSLQQLGHTVIFAGDQRQQAFIRQTFPQIDVRLLEGYRVRYSRSALMFTLLWQLPRLVNRIQQEHQWLKDIVSGEEIDGIISDNRYGLWHSGKPSVILTHQPGIITGLGSWADRLIRRVHYRYLGSFSEVWIPDKAKAEQCLAGKLSHPPVLPAGSQYVGWLSQFSLKGHGVANETHILILLSGPEPQRTMLADALWKQAKALQMPIVFVEGKAGISRDDVPPHIRHLSLADAATLQPILEEAFLVVCRSGYSTLMDLALLGKRAILIPTPGQTEQEYLAKSLAERGIFYAARQQNFFLGKEIDLANSGNKWGVAAPAADDSDSILAILDEWANTL